MSKNIEKILNKIKANLKLQQEKLKLMHENPSCIEYWEDHYGGWKPLTEEKATKFVDDPWNLNELRTNTWYLVKTDRLVKTL